MNTLTVAVFAVGIGIAVELLAIVMRLGRISQAIETLAAPEKTSGKMNLPDPPTRL